MRFNYLFFLFSFIFILNSIFAIALTESDLNNTIYLDNNVLIDYNGFYYNLDFLTEDAGINSYIEIDCNNNYVILDNNSMLSGFFISGSDSNLDNHFGLNELIFRNCNFISDINGFGGSAIVFSDIPNVSVLDSNINLSNSSFIWVASESNLDFLGSKFDLINSMFLYTVGGNISEIRINDLDINYFNENVFGLITVNENSDINFLKISDSNLTVIILMKMFSD
jgi:hypothetical protein